MNHPLHNTIKSIQEGKSISRQELLQFERSGSKHLPKVIAIKDRRYEWIDHGWLCTGRIQGDEVVVENRKVDTRHRRPFCDMCQKRKSGTHFRWRQGTPYRYCQGCRRTLRKEKNNLRQQDFSNGESRL